MLCKQKNLGLEANNHQHLVSHFWIRDFEVKIYLMVAEKATKNFRLKVIICIHLKGALFLATPCLCRVISIVYIARSRSHIASNK